MDIYQGHIGTTKMVAYIMLKFIMHWKLKEEIIGPSLTFKFAYSSCIVKACNSHTPHIALFTPKSWKSQFFLKKFNFLAE